MKAPSKKKAPVTVKGRRRVKTVEVIMSKPDFLSDEQWTLPAGFKSDGSFATLEEVLTPVVSTQSLSSRNARSRRELIIERIKRQKDYPTLSYLGFDDVDKQTAISEIEKESPLGRVIEENEQNAIQYIISKAKRKP
ncbi:MAG TPA: hypothetical protein VK541_14575 [Pedobacter sp.]|uniref:hypothetical protein n=1 Tax=Pedobacter sp. TaxID=1411316 RepID=UPI002C75D0C9|nr:hypothetical protein [Pedobacter sp.]HMI03705.1 hypothetical protein [Pedobacter sp.]